MESIMVTNAYDFVCFKADPALIVDHFMHVVMSSSCSGDAAYSPHIVCVFPEAGSCIAEARVVDGLLDRAAKNRLGRIVNILLMDSLFAWKQDSTQMIHDHDAKPRVSKLTSYHELCDSMERVMNEDTHVRFIIPGVNISNSCRRECEYTGLERYFDLCEDLHARGLVLHGFLNYIYYTCIDWSIMQHDATELTVLEDRQDVDGYIVVVWQSGWRERWDAIKDRCAKRLSWFTGKISNPTTI